MPSYLLRLLLVVCSCLSSAFLLACSCVNGPLSFSLYEYDRVQEVMEVSFFSVEDIGLTQEDFLLLKATYDSLRQVYVANGKRGVPPPPPPPPAYQVLIGGVVKQTFKGALRRDTTWFVSYKNGATCGWTPRMDDTYLIYVDKPREVAGRSLYPLGLCQRRISRKNEQLSFVQERKVLRALSKGQNRKLRPRQRFITRNGKLRYVPFVGGFSQGKRTGVWIINRPLEVWDQGDESFPPVFSITYDQGRIVEIRVLNKEEQHTMRYPRYLRWANSYKIASG